VATRPNHSCKERHRPSAGAPVQATKKASQFPERLAFGLATERVEFPRQPLKNMAHDHNHPLGSDGCDIGGIYSEADLWMRGGNHLNERCFGTRREYRATPGVVRGGSAAIWSKARQTARLRFFSSRSPCRLRPAVPSGRKPRSQECFLQHRTDLS
jgi:hypothetical protein